jgi:hypothetical protein
VIAPDPAVADLCARPIQTGHPDHVLVPLVLRPEHVPVMRDAKEIIADPAMGVLSALFHGRGGTSSEVVRAAYEATNLLAADNDKYTRRYYDFVLAVLPEVARTSLEAMMKTESPYYSDFFRNAEAQGKAKGKVEGKAEDVLLFLELRGVQVSDEQRERILDCADLKQLEIWLRRAVTVQKADELFD